MKVGDLVIWTGHLARDFGIVLELFPGSTMYIKVYWSNRKIYGSHPADDLEVISENR